MKGSGPIKRWFFCKITEMIRTSSTTGGTRPQAWSVKFAVGSPVWVSEILHLLKHELYSAHVTGANSLICRCPLLYKTYRDVMLYTFFRDRTLALR